MKLLFIFLSAGFMACQSPSDSDQTKNSETTVSSTQGEIKLLDAATFNNAVSNKDVVLLDVRTPEEFADGHLENSVNIDINDMNSFSEKVSSLDKETPVYVYCRSGGRSNKSAQYLKEQGFAVTYDLDGGISSWSNNGLKIVK